MKKLKKLVSILLAAVLVFGVAATGFAAAPETVVLEEVAAGAAVAPEEEAPVVEEQPVAEVAAEEEAVADVAAVVESTVTYTVKTADGTAIKGAELNLGLSAAAGGTATIVATDSAGANSLTLATSAAAFAVKSDANGQIVVKYKLTTDSSNATATNIQASVSAGTSPLVYAAVATATANDVAIAADAFTGGATQSKNIALAEKAEAIKYTGKIAVTVYTDAAKTTKVGDGLKVVGVNPDGSAIADGSISATTGLAGVSNITLTNAKLGTYAVSVQGATTGNVAYYADPINVVVGMDSGVAVAADIVANAANTAKVTIDGTTFADSALVGAYAMVSGAEVTLATPVAVTGGKVTLPQLKNGAAAYTGSAYLRYAGGTILGSTYIQEKLDIAVENGVFEPTEMKLRKSPALYQLGFSEQPQSVNGVIGTTVTLNAKASATNFTIKTDDIMYMWQVSTDNGINWTNVNAVTPASTDSSLSVNVTSTTINNLYRVVVYPNDSRAASTITNTVITQNPNIASQAASVGITTGYTVEGYVYSTTGGTVNGGGSAKVNIWTASDYDTKENPAPYATATVSTAGAFITQQLPAGSYVIGLKPTSGTTYTAFNAVNYYGGVARINVTNANITGTEIKFVPTPKAVFTTQPISKTVPVGTAAKFEVKAWDCSGEKAVAMAGTLQYVWQVDAGTGSFTNAGTSGLTATTLSTGATTYVMNGYRYKAIVVDSAAPTVVLGTSDIATLTVGSSTPVSIVKDLPETFEVSAGREATMNLNIVGDAGVAYKWQVDTGYGFADITSGSPYTITNYPNALKPDKAPGTELKIAQRYINSSWEGYKYRVLVTDLSNGKVLNSTVSTLKLVPPTPVSIATQPADTKAVRNRYISFDVEAGGTAPYTFTWQYTTNRGQTYVDASTVGGVIKVDDDNPAKCKLTVPVADGIIKGNGFRVIVKGSDISASGDNVVMSNIAYITDVVENPTAPSIAAQPTDQTVAINREAKFTVEAAGSGPFVYAMQTSTDGGKTWSPSDATLRNLAVVNSEVDVKDKTWKSSPEMTITPSSISQSGTLVKIAVKEWVASGNAATVFSNSAKLTVTEMVKPSIKKQPAPSVAGIVGGTVTLDVEVEGTAPFTYIWEKSTNGYIWTAVGDAATYTTPALTQEDDQTQYRVRVVNKEGDYVISDTSMLTVSPVPTEMVIKGTDSVYIGETADYTIGIKPADAVYEVVWSISESNAKKASIDAGGKLTAKAQGIIKVYAKVTTADGEVKTLSQKVSIKKATTSFGLKSKENRVTLYKGGNGSPKYPWYTQLVLTNVKPSGASSSVKDMIWTTSDRRIATVENGKVKVASGSGSRLGTVIITATDKGNPNSIATYILKVTKP